MKPHAIDGEERYYVVGATAPFDDGPWCSACLNEAREGNYLRGATVSGVDRGSCAYGDCVVCDEEVS